MLLVNGMMDLIINRNKEQIKIIEEDCNLVKISENTYKEIDFNKEIKKHNHLNKNQKVK